MKFKARDYPVVSGKSVVSAEIKPNWGAIALIVIVLAIAWISCGYAWQSGQALADELAWHRLVEETPSPGRNVWIYWPDGQCARMVSYQNEWGFHTATEIITATKWLYVVNDKPVPADYCKYGE